MSCRPEEGGDRDLEISLLLVPGHYSFLVPPAPGETYDPTPVDSNDAAPMDIDDEADDKETKVRRNYPFWHNGCVSQAPWLGKGGNVRLGMYEKSELKGRFCVPVLRDSQVVGRTASPHPRHDQHQSSEATARTARALDHRTGRMVVALRSMRMSLRRLYKGHEHRPSPSSRGKYLPVSNPIESQS